MIFCDLDGVLADFTGAACEVHGRDGSNVSTWNFYEEWGISAEEFWKPINAMGSGFYMDVVKPLPWMTDLFDTVKRSDQEVVVLTSSDENVAGIRGKKLWIEQHLGNVPVIFTGLKHLLAAPQRLLIDDNSKWCTNFALFGGAALLFPRAWNDPDCGASSNGKYLKVIEKLNQWNSHRSITTFDRLEAIDV